MSKVWEVLLIVAGGAIGGIVAIISSWSDSFVLTFTSWTFVSLFLFPAIKGGLSAGIGVYLLTTVDQAQLPRTFFFAAACGLAFPQVLNNAQVYAKDTTSRVASGQAVRSAETISQTVSSIPITSSSASFSASSVAQIRSASAEIVKASPLITVTGAPAADQSISQAITELAKGQSSEVRSTAIDAIRDIGTAAAAAPQSLPLSRDAAVKELKALQSDPDATSTIKKKAADAVGKIEAASPVFP